ncbi:MAG: universal stress protein [Deferribacterales bacterium]
MKDIKKILFALDISEGSDYTFEYAASMARAFDAEITVIHVIHRQTDLRDYYVPHISFEDTDRQIDEAAAKLTADFCEKHRDEFPDITGITAVGVPHERIVEKAKELDASMIVMGTHGRQGFEHFIFGSTAEGVVKNAPCPVLTIRPQKAL